MRWWQVLRALLVLFFSTLAEADPESDSALNTMLMLKAVATLPSDVEHLFVFVSDHIIDGYDNDLIHQHFAVPDHAASGLGDSSVDVAHFGRLLDLQPCASHMFVVATLGTFRTLQNSSDIMRLTRVFSLSFLGTEAAS